MWVREHRDEVHEYTNTSDPVPDGSTAEVRRWLNSYKGTVTKQLREAAEGEGEAEPVEGADPDGDTDIGGGASEGE